MPELSVQLTTYAPSTYCDGQYTSLLPVSIQHANISSWCVENRETVLYIATTQTGVPACLRDGIVCPSKGGDCTVNCNRQSPGMQANTTCLKGDCAIMNCNGNYPCESSSVNCSGLYNVDVVSPKQCTTYLNCAV